MNCNHHDYFRMKNEHSYAAIMGYLGMVAHKARAFRELNPNAIRQFSACLIVSSSMTKPIKDQPESTVDRIKVLKDALYDGDKFDLTITTQRNRELGMKHPTGYYWPLRGNDDNKRLITLNNPPLLKGYENSIRSFTLKSKVARPLSYQDSIYYVLDSLRQSKVHFSYQGGTAWLSVAMGVPTFIVHNVKVLENYPHHLKTRLFGQELGRITVYSPVSDRVESVRAIGDEHHVTLETARNLLHGYS